MRTYPLRFIGGLSLWAASWSAMPAQTPRPMTMVDLINLPQVSDPQLSPDGRQIVFVKSEANWKADRRIGHIWKINADGSGLAQMSNGADGDSSPRWSPDGKTIAFISKRGTEPEAVSQILLLPTSGGEAIPLTTHATAVSNIQWSPDGGTIYFRAADPKPEEQKAREKLKDDVFMFDENFEQQHLWSVAVAGKAEHRITQGPYSVLAYEISEDGKRIAYHRAPTPQIEDGDQSEVWVMDAGGANPVQITHNSVQKPMPSFRRTTRACCFSRRPTRNSRLTTIESFSWRRRAAARRRC